MSEIINTLLPWCFYLGACLIVSGTLVFFLNRFNLHQAIYSWSPETHQKKIKTPTFGGIGIAVNIFLGFLFFRFFSMPLLWVGCVFGAFCLIGFLDDYISILQKDNKGLQAKHKFLLQLLAAFFFVFHYLLLNGPFNLWIILFFIFIIVGASNATNLSDGLDGLLAGLSILTLLGFAWHYYVQLDWQSFQFCIMATIAVFSFLAFNFHPAKIFMGDTGSLGLGALFAGLAITMNNPWILLPLGTVYIIETLSVIIQVSYFKLTQKRLFLMTPIHHHFELMGIKETRIVLLFWGVGLAPMVIFFIIKTL